MMSDPWDWEHADPESRAEVVSLAEAYLGDLLTSVLASDARAATVMSAFAAIGAGLAAVAAALAAIKAESGLVVGPTASAVCFFAASLLAAHAGRPNLFHARGYEPKNLLAGMSGAKHWRQSQLAQDLQRRINHTLAAMAEASRWMRWAHWLAWSALPIGFAFFACWR